MTAGLSGDERSTLEVPQSSGPHGHEAVLIDGGPVEKGRSALLLLHGRGGTAEDILELGRSVAFPGTVLVAPRAAGRSWYPDRFIAPRPALEPWLSSAFERVVTVVNALQERGIGAERILVAGFSQGACLASEVAARSSTQLGGLVALTGGLPGPLGEPLPPIGDRTGLPVLLTSGDPDPHVPWARVRETASILERAGAEVDLRRYPGRPHVVSRDEVAAFRELLSNLEVELSSTDSRRTVPS